MSSGSHERGEYRNKRGSKLPVAWLKRMIMEPEVVPFGSSRLTTGSTQGGHINGFSNFAKDFLLIQSQIPLY